MLILAAIPAFFSLVWHRGALASLEEEAKVSLETAESWLGAIWLDARPRAEFEAGHVPGASPLREADWSECLPAVLYRWRPGRRVVVYCGGRSCSTSETVARRLRRETDWAEVHVLDGGWERWCEKHLE